MLMLRQRALRPAGDGRPRLRAPPLRPAEHLKDHRIGLAAAAPAVQQEVPRHGQRQDARLERRRRDVDGGGGAEHGARIARNGCGRAWRYLLLYVL